MPLVPGVDPGVPELAQGAPVDVAPLGGSWWAWAARALEALGLPPVEVSGALVLAVAVLVMGLNGLLKTEAIKKNKRPAVDGWSWQWLWRLLPALEGLVLGGLFALLGTAPWAACLILGLVGGVFAVPIWHILRRFLPQVK